MNFLDNISIEYKIATGFGAAALVVSLVVGMVSGVGAGTVLFRSLFFMIVFGGLGYGVIFTLKRYVPELFEVISSVSGDSEYAYADPDDNVNLDEENSSPEFSQGAEDVAGEEVETGEGFQEYQKDDFTNYSTNGTETLDPGSSESESKSMGRHIVVDEKTANFEPKIMAQAIRTMLNKDE